MKKEDFSINSRRKFILNFLPSCTFCCLAGSNLIASNNKDSFFYDQHKFLKDSGLSNQDVFDFAFKTWYIPAMKNLMDILGKEKFLELLKQSTDKKHPFKITNDTDLSQRTLKLFAEKIKKSINNTPDYFTCEILRDDENVFEVVFTECLWAKTFAASNALEIGYAGICHGDYSYTKAYNPNILLLRDKTLMQGNDCCHYRWEFKG